jgi:hypothetical protein
MSVNPCFFLRGSAIRNDSRSVTRDPVKRLSNGKSIILGAWRFVNSGTRSVFVRSRRLNCDECWQPIHWWSRRTWLDDGERCAHLKCWKGRLFSKKFVAREIRRSQLMAEEIAHPPRGRYLPRDHRADGSVLQGLHVSPSVPRKRVEQLQVQPQHGVGLAANTRTDRNQPGGGSSLREFERPSFHFLNRGLRTRNFGVYRTASHRPLPRPVCMHCGEVAFSATSAFCTKCGAPFRQ